MQYLTKLKEYGAGIFGEHNRVHFNDGKADLVIEYQSVLNYIAWISMAC